MPLNLRQLAICRLVINVSHLGYLFQVSSLILAISSLELGFYKPGVRHYFSHFILLPKMLGFLTIMLFQKLHWIHVNKDVGTYFPLVIRPYRSLNAPRNDIFYYFHSSFRLITHFLPQNSRCALSKILVL